MLLFLNIDSNDHMQKVFQMGMYLYVPLHVARYLYKQHLYNTNTVQIMYDLTINQKTKCICRVIA